MVRNAGVQRAGKASLLQYQMDAAAFLNSAPCYHSSSSCHSPVKKSSLHSLVFHVRVFAQLTLAMATSLILP